MSFNWHFCKFSIVFIFVIHYAGGADIGKYFTRNPKSIVAPPGDRVAFQCEMNIQVDRIRWKLNGRFLDGKSRDIKIGQNNLNVKVREDRDGYLEQIGDYQCVAEFGGEALTSLPASLSIASMEPPPDRRPQISNFSLEVTVGNSVAIPCQVPNSNPPPFYEFYKDGEQLHENSLQLDSSGVLHLNNVTQEDTGLYWCQATNHILQETRGSNTLLKLIVKSARNSGQVPPRFLIRPQQYYFVPRGGNITLECIAIGHPVPRISWRKLRGNSVRTSGGILQISNLGLSEEGEYVCEAFNGVGQQLTAKSTVVLNIQPEFRKEPMSLIAEEGSEAHLDCQVEGLPKPRVFWLFSGINLADGGNLKITDWGLNITSVEKKHAGLFQCFANNPLGTVTSPAELRVIPKQITANESNFPDLNSHENGHYPKIFQPIPPKSILSSEENGHHKNGKNFHRKKNHHGHNRRKHHKGQGQGQEMTPPSKAMVNRLSEDSVMVRWTVIPNSGYPIQFFKVQYKEVSRRNSRWITIDEDIPPHIHSFEVRDLKVGSTYRFRIAAVFSNHDNKDGPNSDKFTLRREIERNLKPASIPLVVQAGPYNISAIRIAWKYPKANEEGIDGFFLYYREGTSAGEYSKITVLAPHEESDFIISHLKQATGYDVKIQAFNTAGVSVFSQIVAAKTLGVSKNIHGIDDHENLHISRKEQENLDFEEPAPISDSLYLLLGGVFAAFWVFLCIFCAICYKCKQRRVEEEQRAKYPSSEMSIINGGGGGKSKNLKSNGGLPSVVNGSQVIMNGHITQRTSSTGGGTSSAFISSLTSHLDLENKSDLETSFIMSKHQNKITNSRVNIPHTSPLIDAPPKDINFSRQNSNLSSFRSNSLERSPWRKNTSNIVVGNGGKNVNINLNNSRSLPRDKWAGKGSYMTCSSGDEDFDHQRGQNSQNVKIFPKEHYKVNKRAGVRRANLNGPSGSMKMTSIDNRLNLKFSIPQLVVNYFEIFHSHYQPLPVKNFFYITYHTITSKIFFFSLPTIPLPSSLITYHTITYHYH